MASTGTRVDWLAVRKVRSIFATLHHRHEL
jgi:hypothetical protein